MRILVTGGAGFIGSALIRHLVRKTDAQIVNVDKLTYAANLDALEDVAANPRYTFEKLDICDAKGLKRIFETYKPNAVMHLAAESHVDRSIGAPAAFIETNIVGTFRLLEAATAYWQSLGKRAQDDFRFLHVSTDEVFGALTPGAPAFTEESVYQPNSPYAASKAGSDHIARAWHETYGLPVILTNCSNNYGPWQFPEKLIPLAITKAILGEPIPIYGKGENVRDWLHVDDHAEALVLVLGKGRPGSRYNIGGRCERRNIDVVKTLCRLLDERLSGSPHRPHEQLVSFVSDRPGHDFRYAIDADLMQSELGWTPKETFESGLAKTLDWYLANRPWLLAVRESRYSGERLGSLAKAV